MRFLFVRALILVGSVVAGATGALAATGRTPGNASISPSGAATYTIPFWTPPGIRGLSPELGLVYSSRAGDGLAGIGFTVSYGQSYDELPELLKRLESGEVTLIEITF